MFTDSVGNLKACQELGFFLLESNVPLVDFDMLLLKAVESQSKMTIALLQFVR